MKHNIFIDGSEGTTGLKILERFQGREDVNLLKLPEELRKDPEQPKIMLNQADYVFLCLPDDAAKEAVKMVENPKVKIIDASTAHRTHPEWVYGLPELSQSQFDKIASSGRVASPGCYPSGFISLIYPLISLGILPKEALISCFGLSGYSGGGKKTIAAYQNDPPAEFSSPRIYGLSLSHKHLKEMKMVTCLENNPIFTPVINDFYAGMLVSVPLASATLNGKKSAQEIQQVLSEYYQNQTMISVMPFQGEGVLADGFLPANTLAGRDSMELFVCGNQEQILLTARLDNLGKGASGAAVQCMNIMMGLPAETGLSL